MPNLIALVTVVLLLSLAACRRGQRSEDQPGADTAATRYVDALQASADKAKDARDAANKAAAETAAEARKAFE